MAKIKTLIDLDGEQIIPRTTAGAVITDNGSTVANEMGKHQLKPEYNEVAPGTIETIVNNHEYTEGNFVMFGEGGYAKDSGENSVTLMKKQPTATRHNLASFETNGQTVDSGIAKNALLFEGDNDILLKIVNSVEKIPMTE